MAIKPQKGRALLWYNYNPNGTFHPGAMHAGCPVQAGEKYALNIWLDRRAGEPLLWHTTDEISKPHSEL